MRDGNLTLFTDIVNEGIVGNEGGPLPPDHPFNQTLAADKDLGRTLLLVAIAEDQPPDFAEVLLKAGASPEAAQSSTGKFPLMAAAEASGSAGILSMLLDYGADSDRSMPRNCRTALHVCAEKGFVGGVRALLEHGADPDREDKMGRQTPLYLAATKAKNPEVVELLLRHGANPDHKCFSKPVRQHIEVLSFTKQTFNIIN